MKEFSFTSEKEREKFIRNKERDIERYEILINNTKELISEAKNRD